MIELGLKGKDKITGFEGIVTARHSYITGCDQYTLSPIMTKPGELGDCYNFDEGRIEIVDGGIHKDKVKSKRTGGPQVMGKPTK